MSSVLAQKREHLKTVVEEKRDAMEGEGGRVKTQAGLNLSDRATSPPASADRFKGAIHAALLRLPLRVQPAYILSDRSRACRRINSCRLLLPTAGPAVRVPAGCGGGGYG